jgi:cold shock protein
LSRFDSPSQAMFAEEGEAVNVVVKWFNGTKGFGFVAPDDGHGDAFLHVSSLNRAGLQQINEGAELSCMVGPGPKGRQVTRIVSILSEGSPHGANNGGGGYAQTRNHNYEDRGYKTGGYKEAAPQPAGPEVEVKGTVKWFKPEKGFGFIAGDDGDKDIFVHKNLLVSSGLDDLESGQRVKVRAVSAAKGREATWIALATE